MKISPEELRVLMQRVRKIAANHAMRKKRALDPMYATRKVKERHEVDLDELLHWIVSRVLADDEKR